MTKFASQSKAKRSNKTPRTSAKYDGDKPPFDYEERSFESYKIVRLIPRLKSAVKK